MADTPSGVNMNWTSVYYEVGSVLYPIEDVVDVSFDRGGDVRYHRGGADLFPRLMTVPFYTRGARVTGANITSLGQIPVNRRGILAGVFNDLKNGEGSGAIWCTLFNATLIRNPFGGRQNEFGAGMLLFYAVSSDGVTDPLVVTTTL